MAARVFLPWEFINQTRGLMGNWTFNMEDDFTTPDGEYKTWNINTDDVNTDWEQLHNEFAKEWLLRDKEDKDRGKSLFFHENGRSANFYHEKNFLPEFSILPEIPLNVTWVDADLVDDFCGDSYQCKYDYSTTLSREFAMFTKYYQDQFVNIYEAVLKPEAMVTSCGGLSTPGNGRKTTFAFTPGTIVKFECEDGYVLVGERRRWCYDSGDWNWPELGDASCIPEKQYRTMQAGITTGIALAVLVPCACFIICFIQRCRDDGDDGGGGMELRPVGPGERLDPMKENQYKDDLDFSERTIRRDSRDSIRR